MQQNALKVLKNAVKQQRSPGDPGQASLDLHWNSTTDNESTGSKFGVVANGDNSHSAYGRQLMTNFSHSCVSVLS